MTMNSLLRFQPLYQERVWGGRALDSSLGRALPAGGPIGESWEIVDRPEAQSIVRGGPYAGRTLRELILAEGRALLGPDYPVEKPFPVLIKWLDCQERLSLQVHPPKSVAAELKGEPKTENWYIAEAVPGARLIVGLRRGVTRALFEKALQDNTLEDCIHSFPVEAGDSIFVESGRLHAIDAGNLILEIQQNSDTTYRVYDWGRMGLDGKPRQMHVSQSLKSIQWDDFEPAPLKGSRQNAVIARCAEFSIRRVVLRAGETLAFEANEQPRLLSVASGALNTDAGTESLVKGDNVLLPYACAFRFKATQETTLLVTEDFAH